MRHYNNNQFTLGEYNQNTEFKGIPRGNQGKLDVWAFILSLLSIFCCGIPSVISIILSIVVLSNKDGRYVKKGLAMASVIVSGISLIVLTIAFVINLIGPENVMSQVSKLQTGLKSGIVKEELPKKEESNKLNYKAYVYNELLDELNDNALRAETNHQDEYVAIIGYLSSIDSDGKYISIGESEDSYEYLLQTIHCTITDSEQLKQVVNMNIGDTIVVYGQIKSIGESLGYMVDIHSIENKNGDNNEENTSDNEENTSDNEENTSDNEENTSDNEESNIVEGKYTEYYYGDILDELAENALRAETNHQDEYVAITGYLSNIDSDGNYIDLGDPVGNYEHLFKYIQCYIQNDEQRNQIINMNIGDKITVYGKITDIGELIGYQLDIDKIE